MKRLMVSFLVAIFALMAAAVSVTAQKETATGVQIDADLALLRRDLRSEKKQLIAMNLQLTDVEATKFWPVYDQYTADMTKLNDEFWAIVTDYAAKQKVITDQEATAMISRWSEIQVRREMTRQKYIPLIGKVISGRKTALFFQLDRRLSALLDIGVSAQVPLITRDK